MDVYSIATARGGGTTSSRSFGRLKVQRVKDIVKESSFNKKKLGSNEVQENDQVGDFDNSLSKPVVSYDDEFDWLDERSNKRDTFKASRSSTKSFRRVSSSSEFSAGAAKGWGSVESVDTYRPNKVEIVSKKEQRVKANNDFFSRKSFKELGCSDYVIDCLRNLQFVRPSHIQGMAFEPVLSGKSCVMADQSGSGKTLAYLIPLVQRLRQEELEGISKPASQAPRVVILVPTAELASQVLSICRSLSKVGVPFRSMVATGGFRQKTQLESLKQEIDVLIATPGRFMFLVNEGFVQLTNLKRLRSSTAISKRFLIN